MSSFNSKHHNRKKYNASRYAAFGRRPLRDVIRLYPMSGSGLDGHSQLLQDPHTARRPFAIKTLNRHFLFGCEAPIIEDEKGNPTYNEDGTVARRCANPECHGRIQGPISHDDITQDEIDLLGLSKKDADGPIHYEEDNCDGFPHLKTSKIGHPPTLGHYMKLQVMVPGHAKPMSVAELMFNHDSINISGDDKNPIYPGDYMIDKRTGEKRNASAILQIVEASAAAARAYKSLVKRRVTDIKPYWEVAKGINHLYHGTKRKEFDPNDPYGEEYVGIMPGVTPKDPNHVVTSGTLKTIHDHCKLFLKHQGECTVLTGCDGCKAMKAQKDLWDMMPTTVLTQTFAPGEVMNKHLHAPLHVFDVQHFTQAARTGSRRLRLSLFAAFPQFVPSVGEDMSAMGNVGKRDPNVVSWRSPDQEEVVARMVKDHHEAQDPRKLISPIPIQDYDVASDAAALAHAQRAFGLTPGGDSTPKANIDDPDDLRDIFTIGGKD